jgi:hypothetical protein
MRTIKHGWFSESVSAADNGSVPLRHQSNGGVVSRLAHRQFTPQIGAGGHGVVEGGKLIILPERKR